MAGVSTVFEFDVHQMDAYGDHLAVLNESGPVRVSEDIYNQFGVLLIKKGMVLSPTVVKSLGLHRLERSLDQQVTLSKMVTNSDIHQRILAYLKARPGYWAVHEANDFDAALSFLALERSLHPLLRQKLTVMAERLPETFEHSLFIAWCSGLLARELKLSHGSQQNAFLCGLIHEIGLLHLPPDTLDLGSGATPEKVRTMQSHPVIGSRLVEGLQAYDPEVADGILEHHERRDRTGYPSRRAADRLGVLGQLVGSANLLHSMSLTGQDGGTALSGVLPQFRIHAQAFGVDISRAVFRVLSRADYQGRERDHSSWQQLHQRVGGIHLQLMEQEEQLAALQGMAPALSGQPGADGVFQMMEMIAGVFIRSGLGSANHNDWLHEPLDVQDPSQLKTLEEADAVLYELLWLFKRLGWSLERVLEKGSLKANDQARIRQYLAGQSRTLAPGRAAFSQES